MDCTSCVCCKPCRPRYRRLVDNIYPANPNDGLNNNDMQKLTFYAISHPEKLDRIGEYLAQRLGRDVYRERVGSVKVSIEAMDRLLTACHGSRSLNLFVESFLKMVQRLMETVNPELQILATQSFVNFSNIEEDIPSYHRRYDFFISKFSSLCHCNHSNTYLKRKLRISGLKGLRGVVRKTVYDELQANIWEQQHMDKIVPSLLFNMHDDFQLEEEVDSENIEENPKLLADSCLRELTGKAAYGNLRFVLQPLLRHFDLHKLWSPPDFAVACFKAIMYSIQSQYAYVAIQALMSHLDHHSAQADAKLRIGITTVLAGIVPIAATASIGPGILEIFNSMLRHLRSSVEFQHTERCRSIEEEKKYQEILIETMGDFANNLPDYQKVEIMMFIIGKVPMGSPEEKPSDLILRNVLVRTLLKVATKYRTGHLSTALTTTFMDPLLRLALVDDWKVRLLIQRILHTLLDRHANLAALEQIRCQADIGEMQLTIEKYTRNDVMFMKKNGPPLSSALFRSLKKPNNTLENYDAILCTMCLLCVEVGHEETLIELFRLAFGIQNLVRNDGEDLSPWQKAHLHNLVARYFNFSSQLMAIPALCQHVQQVIKRRAELVPCLDLMAVEPPSPDDDFVLEDELVFEKDVIAEALQSSGHEVSRLSMPYVPKPTQDSLRGAANRSLGGGDVTDASAVSIDLDSIDSSLHGSRLASRRNTLARLAGIDSDELPLSFDTLKQIAAQPLEKFREEEAQRSRKIVKMYKTLPFEELVQLNKENLKDMSDSVQRVMQKVRDREALMANGSSKGACRKPALSEIQFPELFVY